MPRRCFFEPARWLAALLALAVLLPMGARSSRAVAQDVNLFAGGGALFSDAPSGSDLEGTAPAGQVGVRVPYTDLFTLQGALSYGGLTAAEGVLQFHPFGRFSVGRVEGVNAYAYGGYGHYLSDGGRGERSVVPLGVGAQVPVSGRVALNLEVGGRWTLATNDPPQSMDLFSGVAPSVGVTFSLDGFGSDDDVDEAETVPPLPSEDGSFQADAETPPARPGRTPRRRAAQAGPMRGPRGIDTTGAVPEGMVRLPAGTFIMGLTDEDPLSVQQAGRKRVSVVPFQIDRSEVSNAEYRAYLSELSSGARAEAQPDSTIFNDTPSRLNWSAYFRGSVYDNYPVIGVSHQQAAAYCAFRGKRLPTEAEWEYAARGGVAGSVYPWRGYDVRNANGRYLANFNPQRSGYAADGYAFTAPVDAYPSNSWGLYNVSGNVAEWVQDAYHSSYADISDFNPLYEDPEESRHVVRGGSWSSNAFYIGLGVRDNQPGDQAAATIGFRCVKDIASAGQGVPSKGAAGTGTEDNETQDTGAGNAESDTTGTGGQE